MLLFTHSVPLIAFLLALFCMKINCASDLDSKADLDFNSIFGNKQELTAELDEFTLWLNTTSPQEFRDKVLQDKRFCQKFTLKQVPRHLLKFLSRRCISYANKDFFIGATLAMLLALDPIAFSAFNAFFDIEPALAKIMVNSGDLCSRINGASLILKLGEIAGSGVDICLTVAKQAHFFVNMTLEEFKKLPEQQQSKITTAMLPSMTEALLKDIIPYMLEKRKIRYLNQLLKCIEESIENFKAKAEVVDEEIKKLQPSDENHKSSLLKSKESNDFNMKLQESFKAVLSKFLRKVGEISNENISGKSTAGPDALDDETTASKNDDTIATKNDDASAPEPTGNEEESVTSTVTIAKDESIKDLSTSALILKGEEILLAATNGKCWGSIVPEMSAINKKTLTIIHLTFITLYRSLHRNISIHHKDWTCVQLSIAEVMKWTPINSLIKKFLKLLGLSPILRYFDHIMNPTIDFDQNAPFEVIDETILAILQEAVNAKTLQIEIGDELAAEASNYVEKSFINFIKEYPKPLKQLLNEPDAPSVQIDPPSLQDKSIDNIEQSKKELEQEDGSSEDKQVPKIVFLDALESGGERPKSSSSSSASSDPPNFEFSAVKSVRNDFGVIFGVTFGISGAVICLGVFFFVRYVRREKHKHAAAKKAASSSTAALSLDDSSSVIIVNRRKSSLAYEKDVENLDIL